MLLVHVPFRDYNHGFGSSLGVERQKVHSGTFSIPFRVLSWKNMTGDVLF